MRSVSESVTSYIDLSAFCSQWRDVDYISLTSIDHTLGLPTNRLLSLPELWRRRSLALESRGDLNRSCDHRFTGTCLCSLQSCVIGLG